MEISLPRRAIFVHFEASLWIEYSRLCPGIVRSQKHATVYVWKSNLDHPQALWLTWQSSWCVFYVTLELQNAIVTWGSADHPLPLTHSLSRSEISKFIERSNQCGSVGVEWSIFGGHTGIYYNNIHYVYSSVLLRLSRNDNPAARNPPEMPRPRGAAEPVFPGMLRGGGVLEFAGCFGGAFPTLSSLWSTFL